MNHQPHTSNKHNIQQSARYSRRSWLCATGGIMALSLTAIPAARAANLMPDILRRTFGGAALQDGRVHLSLPALAENGNSVRLSVSVDSPMTKQDHVLFIQLFAPANPLPDVVRFEFSPLSGAASVETRVRLAAEQDVVAVAGMSDGSLWTAAAHIVVTEAACLEALI